MKIYCIKTYLGLVPASRNDFDTLQNAKLKDKEFYIIEVKKPRNIKFHKKYFALLNICFENQEYFNNAESLRHYLTMKAGFYNRIVTPMGEFFEPKSISFASMDETEFADFYDKSFVEVLKLLQCNGNDILEQLADF